jgi:N-acetylneuraminate synthase
MPKVLKIGEKAVGKGQPVYIVGEIGLNHNGDINIAKKLIDLSLLAGCDAVKFQKRTPELCVPEEMRDVKRETPWGVMSYMEYRKRIEFGENEYYEIDRYCKEKKIDWFASCWDEPSVDFIEKFDPVCYKIASASITDDKLVKHINAKQRPVLLSTGMSTMKEIRAAVANLDSSRLLICHTTSSYPCRPDDSNLLMIKTLDREFDTPIGYSGHEIGLQITLAAVALGACLIERHITLDRAMWGSDQAASVETGGLIRLVRDIRIIEMAMGDGVKKVCDAERPMIQRLRKD